VKWLVLAIFAGAFCSSLIWLDCVERKLTRLQQNVFGIAALTGWFLVLALGATVL